MKKKFAGENPQDKFYLDHERHIPRSLEETIDLILPALELDLIRLWSPELGKTQSVFEVGSICKVLGLLERAPRAPIKGVAIIRTAEMVIAAPTKTISVGGLGAIAGVDFSTSGDVVLHIRGPGLVDVGPVNAKVLYKTGSLVGFAFAEMDTAEKVKIEEFIRSQNL